MFTKIIVPVNFNRNTHMLMQKAVQIANEFGCDLHLLHVQLPTTIIPFFYDGHFAGPQLQGQPEKAIEKLEEIRCFYLPRLKEGKTISVSLETGQWQYMIKKTVITTNADLVLIPGRRKRIEGAIIRKINISKLAQQSQCAVLTITRNFNIHHLHKILVPVGDTLPVQKLAMATYLARQNNGSIHLVTEAGRNFKREKKSRWSISKAYQLIRDYTQVNIHYSPDTVHTGTDSTLALARNVKADLIVLNPGRETLPHGWFRRLLGKYIYSESEIPVLTVSAGTY